MSEITKTIFNKIKRDSVGIQTTSFNGSSGKTHHIELEYIVVVVQELNKVFNARAYRKGGQV